MKDDSLGDVQPFMMIDGLEDDPWIVGKDDHWFIHNGKRLHKESWNAAMDAAINEVLKTYPYSAKEAKIIRE
jgi:hypothetical protein